MPTCGSFLNNPTRKQRVAQTPREGISSTHEDAQEPGSARVLALLGTPRDLGCLAAGFWARQQAPELPERTLSTRPHLNIEGWAEPGDGRTPPAVSQPPASRLPVLLSSSPRAAAASASGFLGRPARRGNAPRHSTSHQNHSLEVPRARAYPAGGPLRAALEASKGNHKLPVEGNPREPGKRLQRSPDDPITGNGALPKGLRTFSKEKTTKEAWRLPNKRAVIGSNFITANTITITIRQQQ